MTVPHGSLRRISVRAGIATGAAAMLALALVGCTKSDSSDTANTSGTAGHVKVEINNDGCTATPNSIAAGAVTFDVTNTNAAAVSEVELLFNGRILAERENIAPGMAAVSFSHNLDGGTYTLYCPGAKTEKSTFTVTGKTVAATGTVADLLKQSSVDYKKYVATQVGPQTADNTGAGSLVDNTKALAAAIDSGDLAAAKAAYPKARVFYERIEPVAGSFCSDGSTDCSENNAVSLDFAIDARTDAVGPTDQWTGFHPIEKGLFEANSLDGLKPLADKLLADVTTLSTVVNKPEFEFAPAEIINGAGDLLDEVSTTKLTGEEEAYSHIDILDMQANIEGSEQAYALVKPALEQIDGPLADSITKAFASVDQYIDSFRDAGSPGGFKLFNQLTPDQIKQVAQAVTAVKDPIAQAGGKIAAAS